MAVIRTVVERDLVWRKMMGTLGNPRRKGSSWVIESDNDDEDDILVERNNNDAGNAVDDENGLVAGAEVDENHNSQRNDIVIDGDEQDELFVTSD